MKHVQIRLDSELSDWFDTEFPIHGAKQWFLEGCVRRLKMLIDSGKVTSPEDMIAAVIAHSAH